MSRITDSNGQQIVYLNVRMEGSVESAPFRAHIPCQAAQFLTSSPSDKAQLLARRVGINAVWTDIATAPINLTPYAGQTIEFEFKVVAAGSFTGSARVALPVRVTHQP